MAGEMAEMDGIQTFSVVGNDDVASAVKGNESVRRGVAGIFFMYKCAGAKADEKADLDQVKAIAEKVGSRVRTMGFALSPCVIPEVGHPNFTVAADEVSIGMGIHGEPGIEVAKMMTADEIAAVMVEKITDDMPLAKGDEVSVMINGLGATPLEEMFIVFAKIHSLLEDRGVRVVMPHIGEFATSMEMAGMSATIIKLDGELKELLRAPAQTPFYTNSNK
jgi:dihydroxyacetone kinase-like protein